MSPLSATFQHLPLPPTSQMMPGGAMPFALSDQDVGAAPTTVMTAARGPRVGLDCTMPVSDDAIVEPPVADAPTVPAAVLLASLDRSARALTTPTMAATVSRSAKVLPTDGKGAGPTKSDKEASGDALETGTRFGEPALQTIDPVVLLPLNPLSPPVGISTPVQTSPAALPEAIAISIPAGSPAGSKPTVVAPSRGIDPAILVGVSSQPGKAPSLSMPVVKPSIPASSNAGNRLVLPADTGSSITLPTVATGKPVERSMPTQDDLPVVVARAMQVDGPRLPGLVQSRPLAGKGTEPTIPSILVAQAQQAATADSVVFGILDRMALDTASAATIIPMSVAQPAAGLSPVGAPVASPDVATIDRQLDLARGDVWLDTLARDIVASADGNHRLRFGLSPEHLGKLDVEVSRGDSGMSIHMTTRNEEARAIIATAQPRLVEELRAQGTRVVSADVSAQTDAHSGGAPRPQIANFIEAAVETHASTADTDARTTADGRYA